VFGWRGVVTDISEAFFDKDYANLSAMVGQARIQGYAHSSSPVYQVMKELGKGHIIAGRFNKQSEEQLL